VAQIVIEAAARWTWLILAASTWGRCLACCHSVRAQGAAWWGTHVPPDREVWSSAPSLVTKRTIW
jgi:hypothetical protein